MSPLQQLIQILGLKDAQATGSPLSTMVGMNHAFAPGGLAQGQQGQEGAPMPEQGMQDQQGMPGASGLSQGPGGGQDDQIPAMLSDGEYVLDSDVVSALGDGSTDEGARRLDQFREIIRNQKRQASPDDVPPKAKSPLDYMREVG